MNGAVPKKCPRCKQGDVTNFSTCRFCGTKYDAHIEQPKSAFGQNLVIGSVVILLAIGLAIYAKSAIDAQHKEKLRPIESRIKASHRPRVIEFYADWCGPCRMYGPVVEESKSKYAGRIDFDRLNVDDDENRPLAEKMGVSSIPRTFFFDKDGNQVDELTGARSAEELDEHVRTLLQH